MTFIILLGSKMVLSLIKWLIHVQYCVFLGKSSLNNTNDIIDSICRRQKDNRTEKNDWIAIAKDNKEKLKTFIESHKPINGMQFNFHRIWILSCHCVPYIWKGHIWIWGRSMDFKQIWYTISTKKDVEADRF